MITATLLLAVAIAASPTPTPTPSMLPIRGITVDITPVQRAPGLAMPAPPASHIERPFGRPGASPTPKPR